MRARLGGAAGLFVVAMFVAACSDGDQPSTLPDVTATATNTPATDTATPTPTGDPTAQLEAEITEFYELYVQTINESFSSDSGLKRRAMMFADSCADCRRGYELAQSARTQGLRLEGGTISVEMVRIDTLSQDQVTFTTLSSSQRGVLRDQNGDVVETLIDTSDLQVMYEAERNGGREWIITNSQASP